MVGTELTQQSKATQKRVEELVALMDTIHGDEEKAVPGVTRFQELYVEIPKEERVFLFQALLARFEVHKGDIEEILRAVLEADEKADPVAWSRLLTGLRRKLESPRLRAFRNFMNSSGGLKFLLDMRADILTLQRRSAADLEPLDEQIAHLFTSWFHQGFLFLNEITQDSPYRTIRFLAQHDMVHPLTNLEDMGHRLGDDRRCFGLYHRAMPEEPVVFIEVALTKGITRSIHDVLTDERVAKARKVKADTAIFYSINNAQNGLAGRGRGKGLVFQVVEALKLSNPEIKNFSTLSPIPGLWTRYLKLILEGEDGAFTLKRKQVGDYFSDRAQQGLLDRVRERTGHRPRDLGQALHSALSDITWIDDPVYLKLLRKPLRELTYHYIANEKNQHGKILNPVANFHLGNGAHISPNDVNFAANRHPRGLESSCGMMANYIYSGGWRLNLERSVRELLPSF